MLKMPCRILARMHTRPYRSYTSMSSGYVMRSKNLPMNLDHLNLELGA